MKSIILLALLISCAHKRDAPEEENLVTVHTALMQAQASYLKGCVEALKDIKVPMAFHGCRDKSIIHRLEIEEIVGER